VPHARHLFQAGHAAADRGRMNFSRTCAAASPAIQLGLPNGPPEVLGSIDQADEVSAPSTVPSSKRFRASGTPHESEAQPTTTESAQPTR